MNERELHERASAIFLQVRDLPEPERPRRLAELAPDPRLRSEVESLLGSDVRVTVQPPTDRPPSHDGVTADLRNRQAGAFAPLAPSPDAPSRIGPYTILGRIGKGGSGYVFLAQQTEPIRRRVAIKIVPHAAIDADLAARFEFERRALERTEHPNIARILDAGRTPDGLPYIVMDYVEGVPITEYARVNQLPLRDRIRLMLDVADAVQHAHQRGVIHRDLKPGNILVGSLGGGSGGGKVVPRVLDFGIAKPTPDAFGMDSPPTSGMPLGTPAYMAPEQTGGNPPPPIDSRADVYGLGAVLYELAAGRPPIASDDGKPGHDLLSHIRRIREEVPPPASRVRGQAGDAFRGDTVTRSLLTDLDCILAKALEKAPGRRYPTVAAFAQDLSRALRREPIEARPATVSYRLARFVQRNRVLAVAGSVVALAVLVGIAGLATGLIEARRQSREAANQFQAQLEVNTFLNDDILAAASPNLKGKDATALDLLRRAEKKVDERFAGRPLIAGSIHHTLGEAYAALGQYDDADRHLASAVALRSAAAGPDARDTVVSQIAVASQLVRRQKFQEGEAALTDVIKRARLILGPDAQPLYSAINDLGLATAYLGRVKESVPILQEALAGRARLLGPRHYETITTASNLALMYSELGDTQKSLETSLELLKIAESLEEPPQKVVLGLNNNVGAIYLDQRKNKDAMPYLRKAAEQAAAWLGPTDPDTLTLRNNLASLEIRTGDVPRGRDLYAQIATDATAALGKGSETTLIARFGYCNSFYVEKKYTECVDAYREAMPEMFAGLGEGHWLPWHAQASLARALRDAGKPDEAKPLAREAADRLAAILGADNTRAKIAAQLAEELEKK